MKLRTLFIALAFSISIFPLPSFANEKPVVESFKVQPETIELNAATTKIDFELIVSHPLGIENEKVEVTIFNSRGDSFTTQLYRTEFPKNFDLKKVVFKGSFSFPRNAYVGVYKYKASTVKNLDLEGYQYETGVIMGPILRTTIGIEEGILVTSFGNLDLDFDTFVGPTYDNFSGISFIDVRKYNSSVVPVWRVGQTYDPSKYFELHVPTLKLFIQSLTPKTCPSTGGLLNFISEGVCSFEVFTEQTNLYKKKTITQNATIKSQKKQIELFVEKIPNQKSENLPKTMDLPPVIGGPNIYVMPKSTTPTICVATDLRLKILSGGTCILAYQTEETEDYEASKVYLQQIEVERKDQAIDFSLPKKIYLREKSIEISASASSGESVKFSVSDPKICTFTNSGLLSLLRTGDCLVTVTQSGTSDFYPVSKTAKMEVLQKVRNKKVTLTCVKGNKTLKIKGKNQKCPKGYVKSR